MTQLKTGSREERKGCEGIFYFAHFAFFARPGSDLQ
jgi:hypothetical protein